MMFDAQLGWVTPPTLPRQAGETEEADWQTQLIPRGEYLLLEMNTGLQYLDIDEPERLPLPPVPQDKGTILSGRIPHWLLVAVYQPPLGAAVVVSSQNEAYHVGQIILHSPPTGGG
ncbi:MAG: CRISPR-associated protein Csx3 [Chloroflexota bacterium]